MIFAKKLWRATGETLNQSSKQQCDSTSVTALERKLIKGYEQTGLVSPKPHGGGAKPKLNSSQLGVVAQLIEQKNDVTLEELAIQLEETIGVRVSRATMGRVVLKLKLTRKKNFARNRARNRTGTAVASPVLA